MSFLKTFNPLLIFRRYTRRKYEWKGEGIAYPGFTYHPRTPNFQDPPYEATKLFRVQRIKPLKHTPGPEREILRTFKLEGKTSDVIIVKNIPQNNARLWRIKHLVQVKPITFPNGFPKDINGTYLKENGELLVSQPVSDKRLELLQSFKTSKKRMDGDTLRRDSRKKWLSGWDTTP